ncbi:MAG: exodeoxyribonuclease V subunit gamma, partial [Clostridia bacterium]|nr:exodeoxyribonuclease V subunit gamma [Clostridia bacterium]
DILAYLRLLHNPNDDVAFLRIVNVPRRGVGDASIAALQDYARSRELPLFPAALMMQTDADNAKLYRKFAAFCGALRSVYAEIGGRPLDAAVRLLLDTIGYDAYLREDRKENYEARAEVVEELLGYIGEFAASMNERETNVLQAFLENVALFSTADSVDEANGAVSLMTLHSAKGLEFPVVCLCGLEDGLFPSSQSLYDPAKLEEERRLCYVGITRAREELHISYARQRMLYGRIDGATPSRFLKELAPALPPDSLPEERPAPRRSAPPVSQAGLHRLTGSAGPPAAPRAEARPARKDAPALSAGQRIRHRSFGDGAVLSMTGSGGGQIVEIAFDSGEIKKFAAA